MTATPEAPPNPRVLERAAVRTTLLDLFGNPAITPAGVKEGLEVLDLTLLGDHPRRAIRGWLRGTVTRNEVCYWVAQVPGVRKET